MRGVIAMSKFSSLLLSAISSIVIILLFSACSTANLANEYDIPVDCEVLQYTASGTTAIPLDEISTATSSGQSEKQPTMPTWPRYADEGIGGIHLECMHVEFFHIFDDIARYLVSMDDYLEWLFATTDMQEDLGASCLINLSAFIEYFGITREMFQEVIDSNFWLYFTYGGETVDVLFSGDEALIDQFFSNCLYQPAQERENRFWSERIMAAQLIAYDNTTEMSWYFHDVWTWSHFSVGKSSRVRWMEGLIDAGEYERVNVVELINHFGLYREGLTPGKTIFEHWATYDNMNLFTHYNFEVLLSGDSQLIREYYSAENEATHTAQVQARFEQHVATHGYTPDTGWMIERRPRTTPPEITRDDLYAAITQAETHTQQNYTPQSWANLQYELEAARATYEDHQSTQQQIDDATESLLAAINALEPIPSASPSPSPTPTPTPTPTPRPGTTPGTTHPSEDEGTTPPAATPTPGPAATPGPPTTPTPSTPSGEPSRTTTTNPETGETITLNRPTTNLPNDFLSDILNRDPVNEILLDETFQLTPSNTPARIGIYVGDQNLSDEQLVALAGFILNPQTGQYEIVRGFLCQDSNTFYVDFNSAGIAGIILYERPTPLLRFTIGQVRYYHNGAPQTSDVAPFLSEGRTMIPIRIISEALGATPVWDDATRTAYIHNGEVVLRLPMGQPIPGGLGIPELINGRVLVPARFVIENFNAVTLWNAELQEVTVYVW